MMQISKKRIFALGLLIVLVVGLLIVLVVGLMIPQEFEAPVDKAGKRSYNSKSFWYYPWGKSGTHKGVGIFAKEGTTVRTSTGGLVLFKGEIKRGGKVVIAYPRW